MQIPEGPSGNPTVSPNQLRIYGAGGFRLDVGEEQRGCPRQYKARYVEKRVKDDGERSYALAYGGMFHEILFRMEEDGLNPDEALEQCFPAWMPPEAWVEARDDLTAYLERGASPTDRFATLSVENELDALLYVDEEYGPTHLRGFVDWMGVDLDEPTTLHIVDYKTNRFPPRVDDVRGDVQLKAYHWLAMQHREKYGIRRVVVHLDAVKWREIEVAYTEQEIEDWHSWCVAVVRKMWRDTEGKPVANPGCAFCPVREDCPEFIGLPAVGSDLSQGLKGLEDPERKLQWRDAANKVRLLLEKAVKSIDDEFRQRAEGEGGLVVGDTRWTMETEWSNEFDLIQLHEVLGDRFYEVVSTSQSRLETLTKGWPPGQTAAVMACVRRVPTGSKVKKGKA